MNNQTNNQIVVFNKIHGPSCSPLINGTPVQFTAINIDDVIDRGVKRLESFVTANPHSECWICFGWMDGGLDSIAVELQVGAFRMIEGDVEYSHSDNDDHKPMFAIPFDNNWQQISLVAKQMLIDSKTQFIR
jgi:hypothetical protein